MFRTIPLLWSFAFCLIEDYEDTAPAGLHRGSYAFSDAL